MNAPTPEQREFLRRLADVATPGAWAAVCDRDTVLALLDALDEAEAAWLGWQTSALALAADIKAALKAAAQ